MRPAPREAAAAWELRAAWASGREVLLSLPRARVRGRVEHVASTGAFALVWDGAGEVHVPCALVRSVRAAHFHEGGEPVEPRRRGPALEPPPPGQLALPVDGGRPAGWLTPAEESTAARARALAARARYR